MKYLIILALAILTALMILQIRFDSKEYERGWETHELKHTTQNWNELMKFVGLEEFKIRRDLNHD